ncbi:SLBB domain-containing protein [Sorangium sp. So ce131]|uniref:SLBB domain-containing protein n=1 Tax=Sorangium sp. So ce131 TaxID=3133282 RepID=UPI003F621551
MVEDAELLAPRLARAAHSLARRRRRDVDPPRPVRRRDAGKRLLAAPAALLVALLAGACSNTMPAPNLLADDKQFPPPAKVEPSGVADTPPAPFQVLPGDVLRLRTTSVDPIDVPAVTVDELGRIHVPLAGDVEVGGLELVAAEKRVEQALKPYDPFGRASLQVVQASGHRVTVVGAVDKPGAYDLRPNARVAEIVVSAGGFKTFDEGGELYDAADLDAARILRDGAALPISLSRAMQGDPRHNVRLRAGDLLFVPPARSRRVVVLGDVRSPRLAPFRSGMRLTEALAIAGGTTKEADNADIRIIRGPLSSPRVYVADLKALVAGRGGDVELAAGDIIFVTEHWFATTTDVVNRLVPPLAAVVVPVLLLRR